MSITKQEYIMLAKQIYKKLPKGRFVYLLSPWDGHSLPIFTVYTIQKFNGAMAQKRLIAYILTQDSAPSLYVLLLKPIIGAAQWIKNFTEFIEKFKHTIKENIERVTFGEAYL